VTRTDREIFDRLGVRGLARAIEDLLDQGQLVRLANACGLRYPGMRTQSQKRNRIVADLAERSGREESTRKAVLRTLRKATAEAARAWTALSAEDRERELAEDPGPTADAKTGQRLFLLAGDPSAPAGDAALARLLAREEARKAGPPPDDAPAARDPEQALKEASRLRKKVAELQKKVAHVEGQVGKGREIEKALKRDIIQRKGELAESRMANEQLRRELQEARGAASEATPAQPTPSQTETAIAEVASSVRKLASEHRRLTHRLEKISEAPPPAASVPPEALAPLSAALEDLHREIAGLRRERRKDFQELGARIEELTTEVRSYRAAALATAPAPKAPSRRKGDPERVGVFVDVQNMYYAARQLKGKLDFDALLQAAVRDRRLIQATAYVVETKEIDQSGFIALLEQRAIEVRRKTLKIRADGSMKGNWDMEMALDVLDAAPRLDVVVLVTGDGDFTSLVGRVKGIGPRVEVIGFPRSTAKSLLEAADRFQPLDRKFMIRTGVEPRAASEGDEAAPPEAVPAQEPAPPGPAH
jgi:uncharacterized LabA/DUF88 family protein